jgi:hypothetical protein
MSFSQTVKYTTYLPTLTSIDCEPSRYQSATHDIPKRAPTNLEKHNLQRKPKSSMPPHANPPIPNPYNTLSKANPSVSAKKKQHNRKKNKLTVTPKPAPRNSPLLSSEPESAPHVDPPRPNTVKQRRHESQSAFPGACSAFSS